MKNFAIRLKELRKEKELTQLQLAEKFNISKSSISMYESGSRMPEYETLEAIADYFNVNLDYLVGKSDIRNHSDDTPHAPPIKGESDDIKPRKTKGVKIPVLGRVAAGVPIEAIEEIIDYEEITEDLARTGEFFCLVISGDSMAPRMLENDIVVVKKQSSIESGEIAVVIVNGCDATVKKVVRHEDGISLIPTNQAYSPKFFTNDEVKTLPVGIIGKVIELRGKF